MAQDPDKPLDSGAIRLPTVDGGHNRIAPSAAQGDKGQSDPQMLRPGEGWKRRPKKTDAELADFMVKVRKRFDLAIKFEADNRRDAIDDMKFLAGEQWSASAIVDRNIDLRPAITINRLPTFVHQVTNEQRMNRPEISISAIGDRSDPQVAQMFRGAIRFLQRECEADIAYDTAFWSSTAIGWGYWRSLTDWVSPDSFDQTIVVRRIRNPFTVYMDVNCQEPDGADAKWCFITEMVPRDEYNTKYPGCDPCSFTLGGHGDVMRDWITQDQVRIAEYYEIEYEERDLVELESGHIGFKDELSDGAKLIPVLRERKTRVPHVVWYKINAYQILDERPWLGDSVPVVRILGDEFDIEGKVKYSGLVRNAKDPQRTYNYAVTAETEVIGLQPKAPFIVAEGQLEGYEQQWKMANRRAYPYLEYRQVDIQGKPAPPPQRQQFPVQPTAWTAMRQAAAQDMMATTGVRFDATLNERTYDESGRALRELRKSGDIGAFHYLDNLAQGLRRQGEIFLDLIPKVIDSKRMITILREDDSEEQVMIDPLSPQSYREDQNPRTQKVLKIYNPKIGKYGVTVTIGPSYATRRVESAESMMDFVRALPNVAPAVADLVAKNQDWPGAEEFTTRLAKFIASTNPNLMSPDMKDVPPQVQAIMQQMQAQIQQLTQERLAMMQQIQSQEEDRSLRLESMNQKFELGLLNIVQKAETMFNKDVGSAIRDMAKATSELRDTLENPKSNGHDSGLPPGAMRAPDGNYYCPDPQRPGKYLMCVAGGESAGNA